MENTTQLAQNCIKFLVQETKNQMGTASVTPTELPNAPFVCVNWQGIAEQGAELVQQTLQSVWPQDMMRHKPLQGSAAPEELWGSIETAITTVRQRVDVGVFPEEHVATVAHFLSANDETIQDSLASIFAVEQNTIYGMGQMYHWVFLFCDFASTAQKNACLATLNWANEHLGDTKRVGMVCLGNVISAGGMLSPEKALENYRAAADILLLANTHSINRTEGHATIRNNMLFQFQQLVGEKRRFMTVSYTLDEKPYRDITHTTLRALIAGYRAQAEVSYQAHSNTAGDGLAQSTFLSLLAGKQAGAGIACLEDGFNETCLPLFPRAADFAFLPNNHLINASEKAFKKAAMSPQTAYAQLNQDSGMHLDAFVQMYFLDAVQSQLEPLKQAAMGRFKRDLQAKFSYLEIKQHFDVYATYLDAAKPVLQAASSGFVGAAYVAALAKAKQAYYAAMLPVLKTVMQSLRTQALQFADDLVTCENELLLPPVQQDPNANVESVPDFYTLKVRDILKKEANCLEMIPFGATPTGIYQALYDKFCALTTSARILFFAGYEQEINSRLRTNLAVRFTDEILLALGDATFQNHYRMVLLKAQTHEQYCILHRDASFMAALGSTLGTPFLTNGVDSAERLMCVSFDLSDLLG